MVGEPSTEALLAMIQALTARVDRLDGGAVPQQQRFDPLARLRAVCTRLGIQPDCEDTVDAVAAAALLGLSPRTLKNDRSYGRHPVESFKRGGRVRYRLEAIARRMGTSGKNLS